MEETAYPNITSFVIRFIQEQPAEDAGPQYRGSIRHVQTDRELSFTRWEDALNFIEQYVPIRPASSSRHPNEDASHPGGE